MENIYTLFQAMALFPKFLCALLHNRWVSVNSVQKNIMYSEFGVEKTPKGYTKCILI